MEPKEFTDWMYSEIEAQHETVDDLVRAFERFNPVMTKTRVGEVINRWQEMEDLTLEHLSEGDFRGLVEHISGVYAKHGSYTPYTDSQSNVLPGVDFTRAFAEESRGTLHYATALLTDGVMRLEGQDRRHYLESAMTQAIENLERATELSSDVVLAKGLSDGAKQYLIQLQVDS